MKRPLRVRVRHQAARARKHPQKKPRRPLLVSLKNWMRLTADADGEGGDAASFRRFHRKNSIAFGAPRSHARQSSVRCV